MSETIARVGRKRHTRPKEKLALAASVIAAKRISTAVAGLSLLALVLLRLCPVFHPILIPLRLVPAFVLFLFLPGFILLNWLLPEMVESCVESVPLALGASLAFWVPVFLAMLTLAVSPTTLLLVALLALLVLLVAYLILAPNVDEREIRLAPAGREFWIVWCGMALGCALMIYTGSYLRSDVVWFHLPTMRRVVDGTHLSRGYVVGRSIGSSRSYIFPLWHIVEALISIVAGVEPAHVFYHGPALLVPTSVLAVYSLVKALFRSDRIACLSTPVYLLAVCYARPQSWGVPFANWLTINYPGGLNRWILTPVVLALLVYYLQCQSSRVWVLGGAVYMLGLTMGAIHANQLFYVLVWLLVLLATYPILIGWNRRVSIRAASIVIIFALSFVAAFWFADTWLTPDHDLSYFGTVQRDNAPGGGYDASQTKITAPYLVVAASALFPLLLATGRKKMPLGVAFVFAGLIASPLLHLEPHIPPIAIQVIPKFGRMNEEIPIFASILIVTATIGTLLPLLDHWVVQKSVILVRRLSGWARWVGFLEICATGALLIWLTTRWQSLKEFVPHEWLTLSPPLFFAYLAFVALLAILAGLWFAKGSLLDMVSRVWKVKEPQYPSLTVIVAAASAALLIIPAFFWLQPPEGGPLLKSDLNTEAGAARFHNSTVWDPELIHFLRDHTAENAIVWSDSECYSLLIPVYVNRFAARVNWAYKGIENLRQHNPTYVLLSQPSTSPTHMNDLMYLSRAFQADVGPFERVYESAQVTLFRMSAAPQQTAELQLNYVLAGNVHLDGEEWDKAITEYEAALTLDPDDPLARLGLGRAYQAQGEMKKAIAELEEAVAANPEDARLHFYLGQAYAEFAGTAGTGRQTYLQEAAEAYRRSYILNWHTTAREGLTEACEKLEGWCQQQGMLDDIVAYFEEIAESDPTDGKLQLELAHWYYAAGRYEEAAATYLRAADLCPEDANIYISLGTVYVAQHRIDDAVAALERAIELDPVQGRAGLAQVYEREGRMDEAISLYLAATDAADGRTKAILLEKVGQIYEAQGKLDKAMAHYLAAAQATVDSGTKRALHRRVADMYLAAGNPEGARCLVRSVLWNDPRNAGSWSLATDVYPDLIEWYEEQGEITLARAMTWELLAIAPRHNAALQALTYYDFTANLSTAEIEATEESSPHVRLIEFTMPTGDQQPVLSMIPEARVSYRLEVPSEPSLLRFSAGLNPRSWDLEGDGSTFEVYVTDEKRARRLLFSEHIGNTLEDRGWHDREVSLLPYAGHEVTITFVTQPGPASDFTGDEAGWANPRLMWAETGAQRFWDFSEEEISAADALKASPGLFATLCPLE